TLQRALHEDQADTTTRSDLERLTASLGRWGDLVSTLEAESQNASDPLVGRDLAVRAGQLAEQQLQDDARATASYRQALDQGGDDEGILEALDRIYARNDKWPELVEVLERRASIASDATVLDAMEVRLAQL